MAQCYKEGMLRALLDGALPAKEHALVTSHLRECTLCCAHLEELRAVAERVGSLLPASAAMSDPVAALERLQVHVRDVRRDQAIDPAFPAGLQRLYPHILGRKIMQTLSDATSHRRRPFFAGAALAVIAIGLLLLPPVRAAADQFLQLFRVQSVMFVPTNPDRLKQLASSLQLDRDSLFTGKPTLLKKPGEPRTVASLAEAAKALSFAPQQPVRFPRALTSSQLMVRDRLVAQFAVNVQTMRQVLAAMDVHDVTIPDALGSAPIVVDLQPTLESHYRGTDFELNLYQGVSPAVKLPDGVDLAQLGKAGLRVLGMDPAQADAVSRSIDWRSTLVFPIPANLQDVRQVSIGKSQGLLVGSERGGGDKAGDAAARGPQWRMYWQRGDRFYMLEGHNLNEAEMLATAESVR